MTIETVEFRDRVNEIDVFIAALPMEVNTVDEQRAAQAAVVSAKKEAKAHKAWFVENILSHSEKAHKEAKAAFDAQKAVLATLLKPFSDWESATDHNIIAFERKERERIRKAQEIENAKFAKRAAAAEAKGKDIETVKPPVLVAPVVKTAKSEGGGYTIKTVQELVVFDEGLVPDEYFDRTINTVRLKTALRNGVVVPGACLKEELASAKRTG